ncbi:hypothetical protein CSB11_02440 [Candidatus Campbellbacteria bacterium]|nr:MAG: hypothetical protein CSB11_02440 [Candidatus Campbellbacteria bacterium]
MFKKGLETEMKIMLFLEKQDKEWLKAREIYEPLPIDEQHCRHILIMMFDKGIVDIKIDHFSETEKSLYSLTDFGVRHKNSEFMTKIRKKVQRDNSKDSEVTIPF